MTLLLQRGPQELCWVWLGFVVKAEGAASCEAVMVKMCIKTMTCPILQLFEDQHFIPGAFT